MLTELCAELKNYFLTNREADIHSGTFTIENGGIDLDFIQNGQYFRIVGSVFNDGVYQYPQTKLTNETFDGSIWAMSVPKAVIDLASDIDDWTKDNADAINSPYQSESFGGYSYSKGGQNGNGQEIQTCWQNQFATRMNPYRRLFVL